MCFEVAAYAWRVFHPSRHSGILGQYQTCEGTAGQK